MAAGDKYFNCDNNNLSIGQILKPLINVDINGKPFLNNGTSDTPVEGSFLLKEDGFYLLYEDGFKIIL